MSPSRSPWWIRGFVFSVAWGFCLAMLQLWLTRAIALTLDMSAATQALVLGAMAFGATVGGVAGSHWPSPRAWMLATGALVALAPVPGPTLAGMTLPCLILAVVLSACAWGAFAAACPTGGLAPRVMALAAAGAAAAGPVAIALARAFGLPALVLATVLGSAVAVLSGSPVAVARGEGARGRRTVAGPDPDAGRRSAEAFILGLAAGMVELTLIPALRLTAGSTFRALACTLSGLWMASAAGALLGSRLDRRATAAWGAIAALVLIPALGWLPLASIPVQATLSPWPVAADLTLWALAATAAGLPALATSALFAGLLAGAPTGRAGVLLSWSMVGGLLGLAVGHAVGSVAGITAPLALAVGLLWLLPLPAWGAGVARPTVRRRLGPAAAAALLGCLVSGWDPTAALCGPFLYASVFQRVSAATGEGLRATVERFGRVVFFRSSPDGCVGVRREPAGTRVLLLDGKPDAATLRDMATQRLLGHLPMLLHPSPRRGAVIGLGSGVTAGSVLAHPVSALDVMEISRGVVEAAPLFAADARHPLEDPRVEVLMGDARALLRDRDDVYDVITSEPSNPWVAGSGALFTREFFEAARRRLAPGGMFTQWLPAYQLAPADLAGILAAYVSVFPHVLAFESVADRDYILLGCARPISPTYDRLAARMGRAPVSEDLAEIEVRDVASLWGRIHSHAALVAGVHAHAPLTDLDLSLELARPLEQREPPAFFSACAQPPPPLAGAPTTFHDTVRRRARVREALALLARGDRRRAEATLEAARREALAAGEPPSYLVGFLLHRVLALEEARRYGEALALLDEHLKVLPGDPDLVNERAKVLVLVGRLAEAQSLLKRILRDHPGHRHARINLSIALELGGDDDAAEAQLLWALRQGARDPALRLREARFHHVRGRTALSAAILAELALAGDVPSAQAELF